MLKNQRKVSLLILVILLINIFIPILEVNAMSRNTLLEKSSIDLSKDLEKKKTLDVIIYLKDQIDINKAENMNKYEVVEDLKSRAKNSQKNILKTLELEKEKGNISNYKSYFIINAIHVRGDYKVIKKIANMEEVKKIYKNNKIYNDDPEKKDNKKNFNRTYAIQKSESKNIEWNIKAIEAPEAWESGATGSGVVVGIIDSGTDWEHDALKEKWRGYDKNDPDNLRVKENWYDATSDSEFPVDDPQGPHGTHVMGTILGSTENDFIGVAPDAEWISAKALTGSGGYDSWLLSSGEWMMNPGGDPGKAPDIINNSWGGNRPENHESYEWYRDMVAAWRAAGILPVFAAGNQGGLFEAGDRTIATPAAYPESFAVGAVNKNNKLASFSQRGPTKYYNDDGSEIIKPDVSAPGVDIRSSVIGNKYGEGWNGTSMAAPHVAGVAALILSVNRDLDIDDVEEIIKSTTTKATDLKYKESPNHGYGYGIVNAKKAVRLARKYTGGNNNIKVDTKVKGYINSNKGTKGRFEVDPLTTYIFKNLSTNINIKIRSEHSINSAKIKIDDKKYNLERTEGNSLNGIYSLDLSDFIIKDKDILKYEIILTDINGNEYSRDDYSIEILRGIEVDKYFEDFSSYPEGWNIKGDWEWGKAYLLSDIYGSLKSFGIGKEILKNNKSELYMPPIDLSNYEGDKAFLRIVDYKALDSNFQDTARVLISKDGGDSWDEIRKDSGKFLEYWDEFNYLTESYIDLTEYIGYEDLINVKFEYESKLPLDSEGWYITELELTSKGQVPKNIRNIKANDYPIGIILNWDKPWNSEVSKYNIYRSNDGENYKKIGESKSKTYLDLDVEENKNYYYKVTTVNLKNEESSFEEAKEVRHSLNEIYNTIYFDDMEKGPGKNKIATGDWEHGKPERVYPKEAFSGEHVWATRVNDIYEAEGKDSELIVDIGELPSGVPIYLNFHSWIDTENMDKDYGNVYISTYNEDDKDWSSWHILNKAPIRSKYKKEQASIFPEFVKERPKWEEYNYILRRYGGKKARIKFEFKTSLYKNDSSTGWYLDDILVYSKSREDSSKLGKINTFGLLDKTKKDDFINLYKNNTDNVVKNPLNAKVSLGKYDKKGRFKSYYTTYSDPKTGYYELNPIISLSGEKLIIRAESHGHKIFEEEIEVDVNKDNIKNITLDRLDNSNISLRVKDFRNQKPIENVNMYIDDYYKVGNSKTNKKGIAVLNNIPTGNYKLILEHDDYVTKNIDLEVNGDNISLGDIELVRKEDKYYETIHDSGNKTGSIVQKIESIYPTGTVIKMNSDLGGKLKGINVYFEDGSYPLPGGNRIGISILESINGVPGNELGSPKYFKINRGEWNYLDLSDRNINVSEEFFVSTIQDNTWQYSPAIGLDTSKEEDEGRYLYYTVSGFYHPSELGTETGKGTPMVRAVLDYDTIKPFFNNNQEVKVKSEFINLEGKSYRNGDVYLYINGKEVKKLKITDREFKVRQSIDVGSNLIELRIEKNGKKIVTDSKKIIRIEDIDKSVLKRKIDELESINMNEYTKETVDTIKEKLIKAKDMVDSKDYSQEEIDNMVIELDNIELKKKPEETPEKPEETPEKPEVEVNFDDINGKELYWAKDSILKLAKQGIIKGRETTKFEPHGNITRAEFTALMVRIMDVEEIDDNIRSFSDVKRGSWYYDEIKKAVSAGIIEGYDDGLFRPEDNITREEISMIISRILNKENISLENKKVLDKFKDKNKVSNWAKEEVSLLVEVGLLKGYDDGTIQSRNNATRAEMAVMLDRFIGLYLKFSQ